MAKSKIQQAGFVAGEQFMIEAPVAYLNLTTPQKSKKPKSGANQTGFQLSLSLRGLPNQFVIKTPTRLTPDEAANLEAKARTYLGLTAVESEKDKGTGIKTWYHNFHITKVDEYGAINPTTFENFNIEKARPQQFLMSEDGASMKPYTGPTPTSGTTIKVFIETFEYTYEGEKGVSGSVKALIYPADMQIYGGGSLAQKIEGFGVKVEGAEPSFEADNFTSGEAVSTAGFQNTPQTPAAETNAFASTVTPEAETNAFFGFGGALGDNPFVQ